MTGATIWFTGLPGAGKSTLARAVAERARAAGRRVEILDGDELRTELSPRLGFAKADRDEHVTRVGYLARLLSRQGVLVLVAVIAPYAEARDRVRAKHEAPFRLVHVATPTAECRRRDPAGLYAAHDAGRLRGLTGVDDPYEIPTNAELRLDTTGRTVDDCVDELWPLIGSLG